MLRIVAVKRNVRDRPHLGTFKEHMADFLLHVHSCPKMATNLPGDTMYMQRLKKNLLNLDFPCTVLRNNMSVDLFSIVQWFAIKIFGNKAHKNCSMTVMAHILKSEDCQLLANSGLVWFMCRLLCRNSSGSLTEAHSMISEICRIFEGVP